MDGIKIPPAYFGAANILWQNVTRADTVSLDDSFEIVARLSINLDNSLTGFWVSHGRFRSPCPRIIGHSRLIFPCSSFFLLLPTVDVNPVNLRASRNDLRCP